MCSRLHRWHQYINLSSWFSMTSKTVNRSGVDGKRATKGSTLRPNAGRALLTSSFSKLTKRCPLEATSASSKSDLTCTSRTTEIQEVWEPIYMQPRGYMAACVMKVPAFTGPFSNRYRYCGNSPWAVFNVSFFASLPFFFLKIGFVVGALSRTEICGAGGRLTSPG